MKCKVSIRKLTFQLNIALSFQLNIEVCDVNVDSLCDRAIINVDITRQNFPPVFTLPEEYTTEISELLPVSSTIMTVTATDKDIEGEIIYGTSGIVPAPSFFQVDENSGVITVRTDLTQNRRLIYAVSNYFFSDSY